MSKLLYICVGGAIGASLRYGVSLMAFRIFGGEFPWGTLIVNMVGCLVAGFFWAILDQTTGSERTNALFFVGLMGAFTTFSAYSLESLRLFQEGQTGLALANVLANNVGSLVAVGAGFFIGKTLFPAAR